MPSTFSVVKRELPSFRAMIWKTSIFSTIQVPIEKCNLCEKKKPDLTSTTKEELMYQSNRSFNVSPPPGGGGAYPGHLTPFPAREGGHLIVTYRGWEIWSLASVSYYKSRRFPGSETAETNFDEFKGKDCVFMAEWSKTKGLHRLCAVFEDV